MHQSDSRTHKRQGQDDVLSAVSLRAGAAAWAVANWREKK